MKEYRIDRDNGGQRLDKFCRRVLFAAPASFCYRMLRKKNITLNGKKASGKELLQEGDRVTFFLSDETFEKFSQKGGDGALSEYTAAFEKIGPLPVIYEDADVLILDKPAGLLSQKAKASDLSANEWVVGYMLDRWKREDHTDPAECARRIRYFRPSVCNRLDRNTGGILICAVSLRGSRVMAELLRKRAVRKFYHMVVVGRVRGSGSVGGWLLKDKETNTVAYWEREEDAPQGAKPICTRYRPLSYSADTDLTLVEAELVTGKTHQLRAHMASIGHPILGDDKYGNRAKNRALSVHGQLLSCCRIEMPGDTGILTQLSGKVFLARDPDIFKKVMGERR